MQRAINHLFYVSLAFIMACSNGKGKLAKNTEPGEEREYAEMEEDEEAMEFDFGAMERYYNRLLADPSTGKIPRNMRNLELQFASTLPVSSDAKREELWKARGPNNLGGRTRAFGIDKTNTDIVLAGSVTGGIYRSTDGGKNWTRTDCPVNAITCIIQDQRDGKTNIWYAGSGELVGASGGASGAYYYGSGILKSNDGGKTWASLPSTIGASSTTFDTDFDGVWNLAIDYSNTAQDEIYAATYGGIYKSTDGGSTWKKKRTGSLTNISYYTDISITSDGVVYATLSSESSHRGIWRSIDGETWISILPTGFSTLYGRMCIGIAPSDQKQVYIMATGTTNFGFVSTNFQGDKEWNSFWKYTYVSGDGTGTGGTWEDRSMNIPDKGGDFGYFSTQGGYDLYVRVKPDDPNVVFIGATNLWRSTDGFSTKDNIDWIGGYAVNTSRPNYQLYQNHHPDNHNLVFVHGSSVKAYSTHDGGVSYTDNIAASSVSWDYRVNNYISSQFYTVAIDHAIALDQKIIGGLQDNGTYFTNVYGMASWQMSLNSDGSYCTIKDGTDEIYASSQQGRIVHLQLDNIGRPLKSARLDPDVLNRNNYDFINPFAIDPNDQKIMYLPANTRLFRNKNIDARPMDAVYDSTRWSTPLWEELTTCAPPSGHQFSAITVSKINPNTLYYATDRGKVFKVNNASAGSPTPKEITGSNFSFGNINCIALDPVDSNHIVAVFSNYGVISLFATNDGGQSWTNISGNLEQNPNGNGNGPSCRWAAMMPLKGGKRSWFVATSVGLYATDSLQGLQTKWLMQSPNAIGKNIVTMLDTRPKDYYIVAATHGFGMFSANIASDFQITSVDPLSAYKMSVYPNPLSGNILMLTFNKDVEKHPDVKLYDIEGRNIPVHINNLNRLDAFNYRLYIPDLVPGTYWLSVRCGSQQWTEKILLLD